MERSELNLNKFHSEFVEMSKKLDTSSSMNTWEASQLYSKAVSLKNSVDFYLSDDEIGNLRQTTYEAYLKLDSDLERIKNEISYEYLN